MPRQKGTACRSSFPWADVAQVVLYCFSACSLSRRCCGAVTAASIADLQETANMHLNLFDHLISLATPQPHLPQVRCKLASTNTLALHLQQACKLHLHSTCRKYAHLISTCGSKKGVHYLPACRRLHRTCLVWTRTCQGLKPTCHGLAAPTSACAHNSGAQQRVQLHTGAKAVAIPTTKRKPS